KHIFVTRNNYLPVVRVKSQISDIVDNVGCERKIFCTEKYPAKSYKMKGQNYSQNSSDSFSESSSLRVFVTTQLHKTLMNGKCYSAQCSPKDKTQTCSVPQSSK